MKRWLKYITSVRTELNIILVFCFLTVFLINFVFSGIPELFKGGAKLGVIVERLCLSYVSSYIFYFVVVHLKNQKDKDNIYTYISDKTYRIIGDTKSLIEYFQRETGYRDSRLNNVPIKFSIALLRVNCLAGILFLHKFLTENNYPKSDYPNLKEVQKICKFLNFYAEAPLMFYPGKTADWFEYFIWFKNRTEESIEKIYIIINFLDSDYIKIVNQIQDSLLFDLVKNIAPIRIPPEPSSFAQILYDHLNNVKLLEDYAERKLKDYQ